MYELCIRCEFTLFLLQPLLLGIYSYEMYVRCTHMFPSWFTIRKKERGTEYEQRQQFSMPRSEVSLNWANTNAPLLACVYCNKLGYHVYTQAHTHRMNSVGPGRQAKAVPSFARFKCCVSCSPSTWFSRKFITTVETKLMVSIILKKNWKDSRESMCQVQVHAITLNYNHDYFKQRAFLVRFIRILNREERQQNMERRKWTSTHVSDCVSRVFAATGWCAHVYTIHAELSC